MRTNDNLGHLVEAKKNNVVVESYTYDANGNRLTDNSRAYSYSTEDHVITAGADTYQFNVDGFLTSKTTSAGTTTYNYSSRGELLNVTLPNGNIISYDHDPMGRRITKRVNGVVVEKYLWKDSIKLLAVYDGNDNLISRFNYADSRMPVSMTYGGATYYLAYDQVGSLRAVTDSSGNIVKRIDYDSFGNVLSDSNPGFVVPFGFAGGLHDKDTGLVRFGSRDYDTYLGKWTAKDPIDFKGGDINLFGYVGNNPVNKVDPKGLYDDVWGGYDAPPGIDISTDLMWAGWLTGMVAETANLYCEVVCHVVIGKGINKIAHSLLSSLGVGGQVVEGLSSAFACEKICSKGAQCIKKKGEQAAMERAHEKLDEYFQGYYQ